jgi:hypothetical protein
MRFSNVILNVDSKQPVYKYWLEKGLRLAYNSNLLPEQKTVDFDYALSIIEEDSEGCVLVVVEDNDCFTLAIFALGQTSHHIEGEGCTIFTMIGNGTHKTAAEVMRIIRAIAKDCSWLQIQRRVAPYTYQGKYYKLKERI